MIAFLGDPTWWKLALWNFLFAMGSGFIMIHFASLLHDRGATPGQIGAALSVIGASHFAGNLLAGWLVDRISPRRMAALLMLMPLAAALLMLKGEDYTALVVAASVLGLASGSDGSLSAFLARHYFGGKLYGQAMATQMVALTLAGGCFALGVWTDARPQRQLRFVVDGRCAGLCGSGVGRLVAARARRSSL